jgi:hypothetical protein
VGGLCFDLLSKGIIYIRSVMVEKYSSPCGRLSHLGESMNFGQMKLLLLVFVLVMFSGCMSLGPKDSDGAVVNVPNSEEEGRIRQRIVEMGFENDVKFMEEEVLVEGCYSFNKATLLQDHPNPLAKSSQRRHDYLVDQTEVRNMTVRIDGSIPADGGQDWWWATVQAINDWNAIPQTSVNFVYTTDANADINVVSDGGALVGTAVAAAKLPCWSWGCTGWGTEGKPGNRIRINLTQYRTPIQMSGALKRSVMAHELGHVIGFHHTNSTEAGNYIEQTPVDPASVMWTTVGNGITDWDKLAVSALYPNYERLGGAWWDQAIGITNLGGYLYLVHNARLYRVDPNDGSYTQLGGAWWDQAVAITAHGTKLYILHASKLYEIEPSTGAYTQRGGASWNQAVAMTAHGSDLYILHAAKLYRVTPSTGSFTQIGGAWWNQASTITSLGSNLYLVHASYLYEVSPSTGGYMQRGGPVYPVAPIKMVARGNFLYIVENGSLNRTDTTGVYLHGQYPLWSNTKGITALGDYVYIIQGAYLVKVYKMEV